MHIGLILNPIAGIGGRVGLKGSDGVDIQQQAFALGAEKEAQTKAALCLAELTGIKKQIFISTVSGEMGENLCKAQGFEHQVIYQPDRPNKTTESDTAKAAQLLSATDIDLLLFAGGDGTARIILNNVEEEQLCLGIPAGCKIYSGVFAVTPADAGRLICAMQSGALIDMNWSQVLDINEAAYRDDRVTTRVYGEMLTPQLGHLVQAVKQSSGENEHEVQEDIAAYVIEKMQQDTLYFIGSGSSTMAIKHQLGVDGTLLGVDVYANGDLLLTDANEQQLLDIMAEYPEFQCRLILTIIGGQGMLFGRGNHQVCHKVIAKLGLKRTWVIASKTKLAQLSGRALGVDTGNHALNQNLAGYVQVITGYQQQSLYPVGKS